jgi:RecA-family ATPase
VTAPTVNKPEMPTSVYGVSAAEFIRDAQDNPSKEIIKGLLHENENVVIHGPEESFKTILAMMLAKNLSNGGWFLGMWKVLKPRKTFFFETEMSPKALGRRAADMWRDETPDDLFFATEEELRQFQRTSMIAAKMQLLKIWVASRDTSVVIVDTANPYFRGHENPDKDTDVGHFFDCFESIPSYYCFTLAVTLNRVAALFFCLSCDPRPSTAAAYTGGPLA